MTQSFHITFIKDARVVEAVNFAMKLVKFCPLFC